MSKLRIHLAFRVNAPFFKLFLYIPCGVPGVTLDSIAITRLFCHLQ
jgi:hypothetical protein